MEVFWAKNWSVIFVCRLFEREIFLHLWKKKEEIGIDFFLMMAVTQTERYKSQVDIKIFWITSGKEKRENKSSSGSTIIK